MNYNYLINEGANQLKKKFIRNPKLDSELLLSSVLNKSREEILLKLNRKVNRYELNKFKLAVRKRQKKMPLAYIIGKKEFWKTEFLINKDVLIPRPETELLVEKALEYLKQGKHYNILDVGTGSGCIIISLLKERTKVKGTAIDISKKSIKIAQINAKMQHLENRIKFVYSDIDNFFSNKYDLIISNPPYINKYKLNSLNEDVKNFEPILALDGGHNGYSKIEKVIKRSSKLLKKNGKIILEIGFDQKLKTRDLLTGNNFYINDIFKDLSGKNRCLVATKI
tara:strand:+ start:178 stop:1020 length:843 start_codon:yes stop_codon:yes gene_type:complete